MIGVMVVQSYKASPSQTKFPLKALAGHLWRNKLLVATTTLAAT